MFTVQKQNLVWSEILDPPRAITNRSPDCCIQGQKWTNSKGFFRHICLMTLRNVITQYKASHPQIYVGASTDLPPTETEKVSELRQQICWLICESLVYDKRRRPAKMVASTIAMLVSHETTAKGLVFHDLIFLFMPSPWSRSPTCKLSHSKNMEVWKN